MDKDLASAQERVRGKDCVERKLVRVSELIDRPPPAASKLHRVAPIRVWSGHVTQDRLRAMVAKLQGYNSLMDFRSGRTNLIKYL